MANETTTCLMYASLRLAADALHLFNYLRSASDEMSQHLGPLASNTGQHAITEAGRNDRAALLDALVQGELNGIGIVYCSSVANMIPGLAAANDEFIHPGGSA